MSIVSIHQPSYFPWLGLLDKINKSDLYIYMDEVQLADRAYQHRNIFLTNTGVVKYLTINISKKEYRKKHIKELKISNPNWNKEHINFLINNYKKHPFFEEIFPILEPYYQKDYLWLNDALFDSMQLILKTLDIKTQVIKMSQLDYDRTKQKSDLILELILKTKNKTYLAGQGSKDYMDLDKYKENGIKVLFQDFNHPVYEQKNTEKFISGLSILDMLFNVGIEKSKQIIAQL